MSTETNFDVEQLLKVVEKSLDDSKAVDVKVIDLRGKTSMADYMVIASGTSSRHVNSVADSAIKDVKDNGVIGIEPEGMELCDWVLLDAGDIIIHIFKPEIREIYNLEGMWSVGDKPEKVKKTAATKTKA